MGGTNASTTAKATHSPISSSRVRSRGTTMVLVVVFAVVSSVAEDFLRLAQHFFILIPTYVVEGLGLSLLKSSKHSTTGTLLARHMYD